MSYISGRDMAGRLDVERARPFSWPSATPAAEADQRSMARGLAWALAIAVTFWGLLAFLVWGL